MRIVKELSEPLVSMGDALARALHVQKVAERLGIDEAVLQRSLPKAGNRPPRRRPRQPPSAEGPVVLEGSASGAFIGGRRIERQIISMMLQFAPMIAPVRTEGLLDHFEDPHLKEIGEAILSQEKDGKVSAVDVMGRCENPALKRMVAALSMAEEKWDPTGCDRLLAQFRTGIQKRQDTLVERIRAAEAAGDMELLHKLLLEKQQKKKASRSH
jgi:hypothetical protein